MEPQERLTKQQRDQLWREKWKLMDRKAEVEKDRSESWRRTRKPNPPLDQERKKLYLKIKSIEETLSERVSKKFWEERWFQGTVTAVALIAILILGIHVVSSNKDFRQDSSLFQLSESK